MIERVAKAIHTAMDEPMPRFVQQKWEDLTDLAREAMLQRARAAIEAMREPDDDMLTAGFDAGDFECPLTPIWQAMIDKALNA